MTTKLDDYFTHLTTHHLLICNTYRFNVSIQNLSTHLRRFHPTIPPAIRSVLTRLSLILKDDIRDESRVSILSDSIPPFQCLNIIHRYRYRSLDYKYLARTRRSIEEYYRVHKRAGIRAGISISLPNLISSIEPL
jgi:hypothetical protein